MKSLLFAAALALPVAAGATAAMEPQQAVQPAPGQGRDEGAGRHPLFTVKFVLRPSQDPMPSILMDDAAPQIAPPGAANVSMALLGALHNDPNTSICYGWGCEIK